VQRLGSKSLVDFEVGWWYYYYWILSESPDAAAAERLKAEERDAGRESGNLAASVLKEIPKQQQSDKLTP
jgi:hypothetical protein